MGPLPLEGAFRAMAIAILAVGIAIGAALFVGLPWLWSLLKPWLHAVTG
ncbi:MAG: hypothetical protein KDH15_21660 [Rhodocyclaceae bacterium]|nr:hypothetical protein [Rhodocyclaceae bacterium]